MPGTKVFSRLLETGFPGEYIHLEWQMPEKVASWLISQLNELNTEAMQDSLPEWCIIISMVNPVWETSKAENKKKPHALPGHEQLIGVTRVDSTDQPRWRDFEVGVYQSSPLIPQALKERLEQWEFLNSLKQLAIALKVDEWLQRET